MVVALGEGNTDNLVALENTPNYGTTKDYTKAFISIYKVSKFGPEILWFTLKRLAVIQVLNTESRIVFSQDKKNPQFKQYKFLPNGFPMIYS